MMDRLLRTGHATLFSTTYRSSPLSVIDFSEYGNLESLVLEDWKCSYCGGRNPTWAKGVPVSLCHHCGGKRE